MKAKVPGPLGGANRVVEIPLRSQLTGLKGLPLFWHSIIERLGHFSMVDSPLRAWDGCEWARTGIGGHPSPENRERNPLAAEDHGD